MYRTDSYKKNSGRGDPILAVAGQSAYIMSSSPLLFIRYYIRTNSDFKNINKNVDAKR